jgi:hypothetical protein
LELVKLRKVFNRCARTLFEMARKSEVEEDADESEAAEGLELLDHWDASSSSSESDDCTQGKSTTALDQRFVQYGASIQRKLSGNTALKYADLIGDIAETVYGSGGDKADYVKKLEQCVANGWRSGVAVKNLIPYTDVQVYVTQHIQVCAHQ